MANALQNEKSRAALASATNSALSNFALRHSVGLGLYRAKNYIENGSGTLFEIESHYFIATAAHCIRKLDLDQIRVAYRETKYSDQFILVKKGALGGTGGDPYDVGYLELDRSVIGDTSAEFLTIDQIALDYDPTQSLVFLFGFPSELVPKDEAIEQRRFRLRSLGLLTVVSIGNTVPDCVDGSIDIVLAYPEQAPSGAETQSYSVPDPEGISGGGIWIYNPNLASPITGSHDARFIGIQKSWLKQKRLVLGNKVIGFLRLLARDYPDVRDTLNCKFGPILG